VEGTEFREGKGEKEKGMENGRRHMGGEQDGGEGGVRKGTLGLATPQKILGPPLDSCCK